MTADAQLSIYDAPPGTPGSTVRHAPPNGGSERDELLTAEEVADRLRMTRAWVYAETRADNIPHLRLGRFIRYRRSAIEDWIVRMEGRYLPSERSR